MERRSASVRSARPGGLRAGSEQDPYQPGHAPQGAIGPGSYLDFCRSAGAPPDGRVEESFPTLVPKLLEELGFQLGIEVGLALRSGHASERGREEHQASKQDQTGQRPAERPTG